MIYDLSGIWQADIKDGKIYKMNVPGTLDENQIGYKDSGSNQWHPDAELGNAGTDFQEDAPIATRFTRKYTFEGEARLTRRLSMELPQGKRIFLEVERARCLRLLVDGVEVPRFERMTLSTPHVFEVTELLCEKCSDTGWVDVELTLLSDNSYPGLPHDAIVYSSAATDETQTNWNGLLGYIRLRIENEVFINAVRAYPKRNTLTVKVEVCAKQIWEGVITLSSAALRERAEKSVCINEGRCELVFEDLALVEDVHLWDEAEGNLYEMTAAVTEGSQKTISFGVRTFGDNGEGRLALNGRTVFLRGETNCGEFPESGYAPTTVDAWLNILRLYQSYGINLVRFHSYCPPKAAFAAADELGMFVQPELSHWNPKDAFETEESYHYYRDELLETIKHLANHPSFVMMTLGNELHASEKGHLRMQELLEAARALDNTRLYADGSNVHYGAIGCDAGSDFYASQKYFEEDLRGTHANMEGYINQQYPGAAANYDETMSHLRESFTKPVFSFEVGQFEILPDFDELEEFQGISEPANLKLIQERVAERGLTSVWKKYVEATGELARICYREEIEAAMRTKELSGIALLGLQDFPGQGTALVGMLNSHLQPKPYEFAKPDKFKEFCTDRLPLVQLPKYTYENTESLKAEILIANFGKTELSGSLQYRLVSEDFATEGIIAEHVTCPVGRLTYIEAKNRYALEIPLSGVTKPTRLNLTVSIGSVKNTYPIWVYPAVTPVCSDNVYETVQFDEQAKEALAVGKTVYLTPPSTKEALSKSIQAQFSTDFWSVGTFAGQEGGMGQLIDRGHPIFRDFPTESHTNWQWWPMASQRAVIMPKPYEAIITELDSYAYLRPMAQLLECRCGKGKLLFSTMGLQNLQQYPEARALLSSIYRYLASPEFEPTQELALEEVEELISAPDPDTASV